MNRLRICIGLIVAALIACTLPAYAGTTFRTAKVCAQTESGVKITKVKFTWTYPGTVGGSGTTDKTGCFTAQYLPVGDVAFTNSRFSTPLKGFTSQKVTYLSIARTIAVAKSGNVVVSFSELQTMSTTLKVQNEFGDVLPTSFELTPSDDGVDESCRNAFYGFDPATGALGNWIANVRRFVFFRKYFSDGDDSTRPTYGIYPIATDLDISAQQPWNNGQSEYRWQTFGDKSFKELQVAFIRSDNANICVQAFIGSGNRVYGQNWVSGLVKFPETTFTVYPAKPGFSQIALSGADKLGRVTLTVKLHGESEWTSDMPLIVSEPKASNPNIGKKVGSCKPVLTATTNAQGKASFTLCPTKNTTVTVKAPPLGIVSQSITVTK